MVILVLCIKQPYRVESDATSHALILLRNTNTKRSRRSTTAVPMGLRQQEKLHDLTFSSILVATGRHEVNNVSYAEFVAAANVVQQP